MSNDSLHAPWRMDYIRSLDKTRSGDCFLCLAARATREEDQRQRMVLWTSEHSIVLMNRFPYANGHLLVAPKAHKSDLDVLSDAESADMRRQVVCAVQLLKRAISPQGFNIGINLGIAAGAGLPGHLHEHIVPRWGGDINFMSVVGDVRIIPQAMTQLYDELLAARQRQLADLAGSTIP